jgi:hypothetical protein
MNSRFRQLVCASLLIASSAVTAQSQKWDFQVFLDDLPIGHHHFTLKDGATERELKSEARFDVKLLFITAYRYTHDATERWRGNCLAQINARTDDNGAKSEVGAEPAFGADGCVMSFAYWNPEMLQQTRLLNAQTGKLETVNITAMGEEKITVRGAPTPAKRYRITGPKHPIDLWYGADRSWLALQSTLESGRRLRYQLK